MKDYLLSEIKEFCSQQKAKGTCNGCFAWDFCRAETTYIEPYDWEIEPRDMIDLPSINKCGLGDKDVRYEVVCRLPNTNEIDAYQYYSIEKAKEQLEEVKKWKKDDYE